MQKHDKSVLLRLRLFTDDVRVSGIERSLAQKFKEPLDNMSEQYSKAAGNLEQKIKASPSLESLLINSFFSGGSVKGERSDYSSVLQEISAGLDLKINEALDILDRKFKGNKRQADVSSDEPANKRQKRT